LENIENLLFFISRVQKGLMVRYKCPNPIHDIGNRQNAYFSVPLEKRQMAYSRGFELNLDRRDFNGKKTQLRR
tara:strand:- start:18 stop:236 length:219 start_codon:yes stop_codon:yes gene_type:complete